MCSICSTMIVDANLLLYAVDESSTHNAAAAAWLEETLDGDSRVGLPWQTIGAFLRIVTHPRVTDNPLSAADACRYVEDWLAVPVVWIPPATEITARVYARLCAQVEITGNLVPDAQLAALAVEHGVEIASADTDFMRFPGLRWTNPLGHG
jgi:toxin-antitoxin system PIN domain toxin